MNFLNSDVGQILILSVAAWLLLSLLMRLCSTRRLALVPILKLVRNLILPTGTVLSILTVARGLPSSSILVRITQTIFWTGTIWILASLVKVLLFNRSAEADWRSRVPGLLVDLLRFSLLIVGAFLVIVLVWDGNLSGALATLGVGSIVIGLALQDTLGNLFSGIALLVERPFKVGDWVGIGDVIGEVLEMNWRAVHLRPRDLDLVVVPNSVLAKERIHNYSRPTAEHAVNIEVGFSYQDPPNKVKRVLLECALATSDILPNGIVIRTLKFADSAVVYQFHFFIVRYDRLPDIEEELMTHIWYAARRNHLNIPFPIRTIYKTELPAIVSRDKKIEVQEALRSIPIFPTLESDEILVLAEDAVIEEFGIGELVVRQGEQGESLYLILKGRAEVLVESAGGEPQRVAQLTAGQYFGEISLLTGESRSATVKAAEDLRLVVIYKESIQALFNARPELVEQISLLVNIRSKELTAIKDSHTGLVANGVSVPRSSPLILRIRQFFGMLD